MVYQICLNMIVKNESRVIERLLKTVLPYIDYYVICDTGSTDDTCKIIEKTLKDIRGCIYHDKWKNFGINRDLALQRVPRNCKYVMTIDADDELVSKYSTNDVKNWLQTIKDDIYYIYKNNDNVLNSVPFLINTRNKKWKFIQPVHNQLICKSKIFSKNQISSDIIYIKVNPMEGAKSHNLTEKEKYLKDALILEKEEKTDSVLFHLAQSYYDAQEYEKSYKSYEEVTRTNKNQEHVYFSKFRMGVCAIRLEKDYQEIKRLLIDANDYRPTRIEALFELIKYCQETQRYQEGYELGLKAMKLERSTDRLYVDHRIYNHHLYDKFSICAFYSKHYTEAIDALNTILRNGYCTKEQETIYKSYILSIKSYI